MVAAADFTALESTEIEAYVDFFRAAPLDIRRARELDILDVAAATCLSCRGLEPAAIFRRAMGIGVTRAATEPELDDVLACMNATCGPEKYVVSVAPRSQPAALATWLASRGFTQGYAWMKFCRAFDVASRTKASSTELDIRVVDRKHSAEFGQVVTMGFGLPATISPWVGELPGRTNWVCVMAFDGASAVAAGAVHINREYAWLGFGTTLPSHRRRGAQSALLARRLGEAAARGARFAVTETGQQVAGKPSASYQNILRAGFEECYLRQNYVSAVG